jgi:hypothetical protein
MFQVGSTEIQEEEGGGREDTNEPKHTIMRKTSLGRSLKKWNEDVSGFTSSCPTVR